jgi:hypothetical protein
MTMCYKALLRLSGTPIHFWKKAHVSAEKRLSRTIVPPDRRGADVGNGT